MQILSEIGNLQVKRDFDKQDSKWLDIRTANRKTRRAHAKAKGGEVIVNSEFTTIRN